MSKQKTISTQILLLFLLGLVFYGTTFKINQQSMTKRFVTPFDQTIIKQKNTVENFTNYEFISVNDLERSPFLNRTFTQMNKLSLTYNTTWKISEEESYQILNATLRFICHDEQQRIDFVGDEILVFDQVYAELILDFSFKIIKNDKAIQGKGKATSKTPEIAYAVAIYASEQQKGFYDIFLLDYVRIDQILFRNVSFALTLTNEQKQKITTLLNPESTVPSINKPLFNDYTKYFPQLLDASFYDLISLSDTNREYSYSFIKFNEVYLLNTVKIPTFYKVYKGLGIKVGYINSLQKLKNQTYQLIQIPQNLPTQTYGGRQQFISYQFYKNFIAQFIQNQYIFTKLQRQSWGTSSFNFYAQDLFPIFNNIDNVFDPYSEIQGYCLASDSQNVTVKKFTNSSFKVSFNLNCQITIDSKSMILVNLKPLQLQIYAIPKSQTIDFWVKSANPNAQIIEGIVFTLKDKAGALKIINDVISRLFENKIDGSGWKLAAFQKSPIFTTVQTGTFVTDLDLKSE